MTTAEMPILDQALDLIQQLSPRDRLRLVRRVIADIDQSLETDAWDDLFAMRADEEVQQPGAAHSSYIVSEMRR